MFGTLSPILGTQTIKLQNSILRRKLHHTVYECCNTEILEISRLIQRANCKLQVHLKILRNIKISLILNSPQLELNVPSSGSTVKDYEIILWNFYYYVKTKLKITLELKSFVCYFYLFDTELVITLCMATTSSTKAKVNIR